MLIPSADTNSFLLFWNQTEYLIRYTLIITSWYLFMVDCETSSFLKTYIKQSQLLIPDGIDCHEGVNKDAWTAHFVEALS